MRTWIRPVLLVMCACGVSQGFARFTFSFVLPDMTADVLGSYGVAGLLGGAHLGAYLLGVLGTTTLARRAEGTGLLKAGLASTALGLLLTAVAPWTWLLFAGLALTGLSSAAVWIPAPSIVAAHVPRHRNGLAIGLVTAGIGITIAMTGPAVTLLQRLFGAGTWRPVWGLAATVAVLVLVAQVLFLRPVGAHPDAGPERRPLRALLPEVRTLLLSYFLYGVGFALYTNYLIAALQHDLGFDVAAATGTFSLLGVASIFGGLVGGRLSDSLGRRRTLVAFLAVIGAAPLAVPLRWHAAIQLSVLLYGLLMTGIGTVLMAYLGDRQGPGDISAAFGVTTMSLGLAQFLAPPLGGRLADVSGSFDSTFYLASGTAVLAAVVSAFLPDGGRPRGRRP
jgi:predicted MFS family arabinose efflux permease